MSSVPNEVLRDVLLPHSPLSGWFTNRRFLRLIVERMSDVCLRQVDYAGFWAPNEDTHGSSYVIRIDGSPQRRISHEDTARRFSEFVQALRGWLVAHLMLVGLVFRSELATLILQAPITADALSLSENSCVELTPALLHKVLLHFAPTSLNITACQLRACQLTDELIRALSKNRMRRMKFEKLVPVDGGNFHVTDDAIVDFSLQQDAQIRQEGVAETEWSRGAAGRVQRQLHEGPLHASGGGKLSVSA